jgi:chromosome segregation ATPase
MTTDLEVSLGEKLALAEHRYQRLVEEVQTLKEETVQIEELKEELEDVGIREEELNTRVQELLEENEDYEIRIDDHDSEIEDHEDTIRERDGDIEDLNTEIEQLKEIIPSDDFITDLTHKIVEYQSTVPGTSLRIEVGKEVSQMIEGVLETMLPEGPKVHLSEG